MGFRVLMLKTSSLFRDGSSCVYVLAGLHPDFSWCKSSLKSAVQDFRDESQLKGAIFTRLINPYRFKNRVERAEQLDEQSMDVYHKILLEAKAREDKFMLEPVSVLLKAAERLKSTFWFGILEDTERSLELLKYQLGNHEDIVLPHFNRGTYHKTNETDENKRDEGHAPTPSTENKKYISDNNREFLEKLLPMDIWLYEYAKNLFEARWQLYKYGKSVEISVPALPDIDCIVTSLAMKCKSLDLSLTLNKSEGWAGYVAWNDLITENDSRFLKWF